MSDKYDFKADAEDGFADEEEAEAWLDTFVETLEGIEEDTQDLIDVVNPRRVQEVIYVYKLMKLITRGENLKITYEIHQPSKTMGVVKIIGRDVWFCNTGLFAKAGALATNFESVPKLDGTVEINFGFYGLVQTFKGDS